MNKYRLLSAMMDLHWSSLLCKKPWKTNICKSQFSKNGKKIVQDPTSPWHFSSNSAVTWWATSYLCTLLKNEFHFYADFRALCELHFRLWWPMMWMQKYGRSVPFYEHLHLPISCGVLPLVIGCSSTCE